MNKKPIDSLLLLFGFSRQFRAFLDLDNSGVCFALATMNIQSSLVMSSMPDQVLQDACELKECDKTREVYSTEVTSSKHMPTLLFYGYEKGWIIIKILRCICTCA